jgi:hypothetical protein
MKSNRKMSKLERVFACYAKDILQSHSQMTHLDSSSLSPTTSAGTRNRPLLPHFEHLLASLQVRKLIFIISPVSPSSSSSGWIKIFFHTIPTALYHWRIRIIVLVSLFHHHFHLFLLHHQPHKIHILSLTSKNINNISLICNGF